MTSIRRWVTQFFCNISGSDCATKGKRLLSWVNLIAVSPVLENRNANSFLSALIRKSTKSPNFGCGQLVDVDGVVQRVHETRAGSASSCRILVPLLSVQITWEHPSIDVVGTQASIESKDCLSIVVRPVGSGNRAVPLEWEKIYRGSSVSREVFTRL